jgi:hypothetical protein
MTMTPERLDSLADEVVHKLGLQKALNEYGDEVHARLKQANEDAEAAPMNSDMIFIALALPMVNGLIHFASTRGRLQEAMKHMTNDWKVSDEADPLSTLSALTLIHIANRALAEGGRSNRHPEERDTWSQIRKRIELLKRDMERRRQ